MRLEKKIAIVTGGANGMGRSTAIRFLQEGASVVIADYNDTNGADTIRKIEEQGFGDSVRFIKTDVSKEGDIKKMIECAADNFGGLDIIFNNAGVGGAVGPVWDLSLIHI